MISKGFHRSCSTANLSLAWWSDLSWFTFLRWEVALSTLGHRTNEQWHLHYKGALCRRIMSEFFERTLHWKSLNIEILNVSCGFAENMYCKYAKKLSNDTSTESVQKMTNFLFSLQSGFVIVKIKTTGKSRFLICSSITLLKFDCRINIEKILTHFTGRSTRDFTFFYICDRILTLLP